MDLIPAYTSETGRRRARGTGKVQIGWNPDRVDGWQKGKPFAGHLQRLGQTRPEFEIEELSVPELEAMVPARTLPGE